MSGTPTTPSMDGRARYLVRRLPAPWTLHLWGPGSVGAGSFRWTDGVLHRREDGGGTAVELLPDGTLNVWCRCAPPVVHLTASGATSVVPVTGQGTATTRIGAGDVAVLASCELLQDAPAAMAAVTTVLGGRTRDGVSDEALAVIDTLLMDASSPDPSLAVLVIDPDRFC